MGLKVERKPFETEYNICPENSIRKETQPCGWSYDLRNGL